MADTGAGDLACDEAGVMHKVSLAPSENEAEGSDADDNFFYASCFAECEAFGNECLFFEVRQSVIEGFVRTALSFTRV